MEKRRVRIYKAGGQQGSYINKTAKYFQEGGMQTEQEQPTQEFDDNQLISIMMQRLSKDDETANMQYAENDLAQLNIDPTRIKKLSNYVTNYIDDQRSLQDAQQMGDEETAAKLQAEEDSNQRAAQEEEELLAQEHQQQQQQLQDIYNEDNSSQDEAAYDQAESDIIMRKGGMLNKKTYINNFMKLAKKQEGGDTEKTKPDISTDRPIDGREERRSKFYNALKSTANTAALKEQAKKQYEQQMQQMQQMPPQGYAQDGGNMFLNQDGSSMFPNQDEDPENPMHHIGAYATGIHDIFDSPQVGTSSGPEQLQFGGWGHGKERRAARRMNRMMPQGFSQMANPFMQQQMNPLAQFMPNQGNLGLANIDVRRTGIFGRPKEYTINFNTASPVTIKDIEDTKKQEVNNAETTKKEVEETIKKEETNTASTKNAEVAKAAETLPDAENIYIVDDKVKKNSGTTVTDNVVSNETVSDGTVTNETISDETTPIVKTPVVKKPIVKTPIVETPIVKTPVVKTPVLKESKPQIKPIPQKKLPVKKPSSMTNTLWNAAKALAGTGLYGKPLPTPRKMSNEHLWDSLHSVFAPMLGFQEGGFTDPDSGLYKFMGGGEDMEQYNLDYSDSKNVSSPYFQSGGYFQTAGQTDDTVVDILDKAGNVVRKGTLAEAERAGLNHRIATTTKELDKTVTDNNVANIDYAQQYMQAHGINNPFSFISRGNNWNKAVGSPYGTKTLNPISGMIGPNAQVSSINVNKSRLNGTPKKFTVNYNVPGQPGINASGTPQSYVGSDGQTHWIGSDQGTRGVIGTADRPESRASSMYRRLTEKDFSPTEKNSIYDDNGMPTNDYAPGVIENLRNPGSTIPLQYINAILGNGVNGAKSSLRSADDVNMTGTGSYSETGYSPRVIAPYSGPMTQGTPPDQSYFESGNTGSVGYDPEKGFYAYGGQSLPKAQFGPTGEKPDVPFGYFKDPASGLYKNLAGQVYAPKTNLQGTSDKLMSNNFTQEGNGLTTDKSMGFDASGNAYRNEGLLSDEEKQAGASQQVSQKFKNKQEWNIDAKGALDFGNMAGNAFAGFIDRAQQAKQNRNMGSKYDASNLYAQTDEKDRGTYGQEGDFRPDQTGFKGVVKYGGYMKEGGSYEEGGDTWMSEEQIQQFLAEGGELEFV